MHKDHNNTHLMVPDAQFYAGIDVGDKLKGKRHYAPIYFCENWEDADEFVPYVYVDITPGFELWQKAMQTHWFIMNSKSFPYYDYYSALARVRGCLNRTQYAEGFAVYDRQKTVKREML